MAQRDWLSEAVSQVGQRTSETEAQATATFLAMRRQQDNAEEARRAAELSRWSGLPTETAARNRQELQAARDGERDTAVIRSQPGLQSWVGADTRNASSAQGDVQALGAASYWFGPAGTGDILGASQGQSRLQTQMAQDFAQSLGRRRTGAELLRGAQASARVEATRKAELERNRPNANTYSVAKGLAVDSVEGLKQSWIGTKMFLADAVGIPRDSQVFTDILGDWNNSKERAQSTRPVIDSTLGQSVYGGVSSFLQTLPALAAVPFTDGASLLGIFGAQAGTAAYGKYAARGATPGQAFLGGTLEGGIEAATELLPTRFLVSKFGEKGIGAFVGGFLGREMLGEQIATASQDAVDTAIANPTATWSQYLAERPRAAFDTAVAVGVSTGALTTGSALFGKLRETGREVSDAAHAVTGARFLDQAIGVAEESNLRRDDPEGFREFVKAQTQGSTVANVYVPADSIRSLMQSEGRSLEQDEFWSRYSDQIAEASAIGGDVVIPIEEAVVGFAGNRQWDTLRDTVRLSPGGISMAEARSIAESYQTMMADRGEEAAGQMREEMAQQAPARRVYDEVFSQTRQAGMSVNAASSYADLYAARYQTRAERLGVNAYDLYRQSLSGITGEAPSSVRRYDAADEVDALVNTMRRGKDVPSDRSRFGPTLLEYISATGGIDDSGGDIASMGGDQWHRSGAFRRKLIRRSAADIRASEAQGDALGGSSTGRGIDDVLQSAIDAGYFPELQGQADLSGGVDESTYDGKADTSVLLDAISNELSGAPRYAAERGTDAQEADASAREAADDLRQFLEGRGIDADTAPIEDIRAAIKEGDPASRSFGQGEGSPRGRIDFAENGQAIIRLFEGHDLSTLLHESGHLWVEELQADAAKAVAPKGITLFHGSPRNDLTLADIKVLGGEGRKQGGKYGGFYASRAADVTHAEGYAAMGDAGAGTVYRIDLVPGAVVEEKAGDITRLSETAISEYRQRGVDVVMGKDPRGRVEYAIINEGAIARFGDRATMPDEASPLAADWEAVKAWFAANGHPVGEDGVIPTEAHEMWARGMERYFMEGKAPTSSLARAFSSFRAWMLRIYQMVANLNTPLTDEVRGVMDRMLATDDAISAVSETAENALLFKSAADAGMTDAEYGAYRASVSNARDSAMDALVYRTMETVRRSRTEEWKRDRLAVRAEVEKIVTNRAEFRALALLRGRDGERMPLSRDDIVNEYGSDFLALLPRGVPPTIVPTGGVHPDILAERAGFRTGREMLHMLAGIETRTRELRAAGDNRSVLQETIEQETDTAMRDRFGDVLSDGSIEEEALAAIHNDQRSEVITAEIRALSRRTSRAGDVVPTPLSAARSFAERVVREGKVSEQASGAALARHRRNEEKAARAAERAILEGNIDEAFRQKQNQLHHNALFRAAKDAKDNVDVIVKRLGRYAKAAKMANMDPDYLDRIHELLEVFDFRRRSARDIKERVTFAAWVEARQEAGEEVFIPDRLKDARAVNFSEVQVQDLVALDDTVESIAFLGRRKGALLAAREEAKLEDIVAEAVAVGEALPARAFSNERNPAPNWRSRLRSLDALLVKVEWLSDQLDGGDNPNGVFNRVLVRGADDAANEKERLTEKVLKPLSDLYNGMSKEQRKRLQRKVVVPELVTRDPETLVEGPTVYTGMDLLAIALNTGNESNLDKMVRGESRIVSDENAWDAGKVMQVLDRELEMEDWQFVEKVWRQVDSLWPDIVKSEREISGIKPEKVDPRIVQTRHGAINGGYYPVVYDPTRSAMAEANYEDDAEKMLGQMGRSVSTPKGHTITRTGAAAPLLLSVEAVLLNHVNRVTTRIAYGRFVRDSLKFINHPRIKDLINRKMGPEYHKQLRPWLARQVNDAAMDTKQLVALDKLMRQFRINTTMVGLGFRATTMLAQAGGWSNSMSRIGPKWMAQGAREMARNYGGVRQYVFDKSPEMAGRAQSFDRDVRAAFRSMSGDASKFDKFRELAFWGIGNVQLWVVDMPTWLGAYSKATHEGMNEADAVAYADKIIRKSQGAGRAKDLSAIQGGPEMAQVLTMFYSYFNVLYNAQRETVHSARTGDYRRAASNVVWLMMVGPLLSALLTGDWPQEDKDEDWMEWAVRKMFFGLWAGVPGMRDVMGYAERKVSGQFASPAQTPFIRAWTEMLNGPVTDAVNAAKGDPVSDRWLQHAITSPGYFVGLPTGQIGNTSQYLFDVAQGRQKPKDAQDVAAGVIKGPRKEQE